MLRVAFLNRHREIDALPLQFGHEVIDVAADTPKVCGNRGGVHQDTDWGGEEGGHEGPPGRGNESSLL